MLLGLLAFNVVLAGAVTALSVAVTTRRRAGAGGGADADAASPGPPIAAVLSAALSGDERAAATAAARVAGHPSRYQAALVSLMAIAATAAPRARLACLRAIAAILRVRPELCRVCWQDANPDVRATAVSSIRLQRRGDEDRVRVVAAATAIIDAALVDQDARVRRAAYRRLSLLPPGRAAEAAWRGLDDEDVEVRRVASAVLSGHLAPEHAYALVQRLASTSAPPSATCMLLEAISRTKPTPLEGPLVAVASITTDLSMRVAALTAIGAAGGPQACLDLSAFVSDAHPRVRRAAAQAIREIGRVARGKGIARAVVVALSTQLGREEDARVSLALIEALEASRDATALRAVMDKLPKLDAGMQQRGTEAIMALRGGCKFSSPPLRTPRTPRNSRVLLQVLASASSGSSVVEKFRAHSETHSWSRKCTRC